MFLIIILILLAVGIVVALLPMFGTIIVILLIIGAIALLINAINEADRRRSERLAKEIRAKRRSMGYDQ